MMIDYNTVLTVATCLDKVLTFARRYDVSYVNLTINISLS